MPKPQTIAVAMSGGVDSSTVAAMLRADGHEVIGLTMQLWNQRRLAGREGMPESVQGRCCSLDDVYDARRGAETIGIPYYVVNHEQRFEDEVVRPFVQEYLSRRTPIPCSLCNNHLKFDQRFLDAYLEEQGDSLPDTAGELVTTNGEVVGEHHGIHNFTVGQRKGLGVATGSPLYVIQIKGDTRQVVVGNSDQLYSRTLRAHR